MRKNFIMEIKHESVTDVQIMSNYCESLLRNCLSRYVRLLDDEGLLLKNTRLLENY